MTTRGEVEGMLAEQRSKGEIALSFLQQDEAKDLHLVSLHARRSGSHWLAAMIIGGEFGIDPFIKTRTFVDGEASAVLAEALDQLFLVVERFGTLAQLKVTTASNASWIEVPHGVVPSKGGQA